MVAEGETTQSDGNASFLRAARGGNLEKVLEYLKGSIDINTSNANGLNALHLASKEGHVVVVTELLKRGANVNAATKKGNTALHIASLAGQEEVMKILVQHGANVNVQSQNGFTPLYMAAQENHDRVVSNLLSSGANQSLATEDGFTPLAVALQQGHDKVVAVLLENDAKGRVRLPALHIAAKKDDCKAASLLLQNDHNPDVQSKSGFTPLHIAAHYGNESIATLLLEKHADVNFAAKHQITPLHVASKWGKANMVILLLDKGAKIDSSTRDGLTPLHCAARSGHDQVIDLLLERGAPMSAKTKNGLSPLHMACQGDHVDSARILLYHKASVDDVTVDYLTALHVAAHCGHVRVAKLLLDRKADPNARALNGFTPLHIACKKNRIKVVELLLKHGASIEATTESGLTPLHVASFMGCMNIVIYLIQHRANPDIPTVRGETPLHLAARANQTDIIRILLRNGAHVDARAREDQTPLHIAARLGNVDIVGLLLQHGAAVDATTKDMYTALHIAAKEGQEEVASVLLDHSASLTATTKKGFTPLHLAAKYGNIKVARLLLQKDAPVDAQGKNGVTPLHVAAHYDHVNVALLLLDKGASPHATAKNGYTSLHIAAKKNQMDIATTLLEYGAKAEAESKAGFTPLHLASQEGHTDMTTLLIEHHANPNSKAKNGLTPLHLCAQDDRVNVAAILVKNGAEVDPPTKAGYTPLHVASHFGQINMIRFLLQHNADVNALNSHGYTPLHQAAQQGHTLIINLLLEHRASPNVTTNQGQTALSIAQRLGYISVIETLKVVTETTVTTTTTTITEEKYRVVAPETMQETFMSDSEDEGVGEDTMLGDQSFRYLSADEMKSLGDDSLPIDVTKDERSHDSLGMGLDHGAPLTVEEEHLSPQHVSHNVDAVFTGNFAPDNIDISRAPIHAGKLKWKTFLVSFMVDARGGAMRGCRHSGVRVIIPPRKAPMPMRITCRYLRKEKLIHPPPLMEGEACASRILEVGPVGAKFLGPVILEIPHFASLRGKEREITILRSDNGETWREHTLEASEEAVQDVLNESFEGEDLSALEDLNTNRITRILTTDFPQYFAIVTRIRQEVHAIGPEGGMVSSTVVPQVQAIFPEGALTKKIKVGLQAQPIPSELVTKLLGNRIAVSPIVTVEPRRRKFHKPITLTIPVPQAATRGMINQYSGDAPTLRLLCSITGGTTKAQWEDVTGSTPLTFVNDCVSFTTTVSARFWLMDCRQVAEATKFATELYREAIHAPFMAKFVVFAKRPEPSEAQLRVFCMTDDKEDKTLESQERFIEVAKSRDVEVLESKPQFLEFAGNLVPVTKSGEQLSLTFQAFKENRLPFTTRIKDVHQDPLGRIAFMKEPKVSKGEPPQTPICNLNILLPDIYTVDGRPTAEMVTLEKKYGFVEETGLAKPELIQRADLRLSDIARELNRDWVPLALQLDIPESDIKSIKTECPDDMMQQALTMLRLWMQRAGTKATGNSLDKALRKINREDIVDKCMFNVKLFTDDVEKAVAKVRLDQSGFDAFKEELGPSRDASLRREVSLDVSYDEQDLMKVSEAESAAETSSESGSVHGKEPHDTSELRGESKLLKGIKTPPPSPAEKEEKEQVVVYETPATTSTRVETREVMDDGSVRRVVTTVTKTSVAPEMEEMPHELRDQLAKLESETWPSAEMDTSQVSVSSLPEDEKSEPTTATVSSAGTDMASDEKPQIETHTDEAEWTETDESGGVRHVIQKRTHTTVKMQDQGLCEPGKQQWDSTTTEQQPEEKHSDTISPEEELSFEQKRSFFQRLSIDGSTTSVPLPASKPSQSSSDSSKKSCEGDGNGEVLEEQISFSERLKFFEKPQDTSSKRNSYPQYQGTESPDLSDKRKSFPSHAATFVEEEGSISVQDMKKYFNPEEVQAQRTCLEEEVEVSKPVSELKKMFKDDDEKKPEKVQSLEAEQTELWQQLDDNIQQAKVAMENMERELTEAEAMSAIQERNQPAFAEALSDVNSKTEMKLMVKTVEPGRESIEVRSMKGYVDSQTGEIARVLVRSPVQDVSGETISATQSLEHGLTEQRRIESELTEDEISPPKDYPSPPKTVGLEEVESPIPRPSPPEPSFGLEQEISPVVDYPEGLTADLQVRVGVSPTELDYQHESAFRGEISSHKMSRDSKQDDVFSSENVAFTEKTVRVTRTFTGSSGTGLSETSVDLEIEQNYPESAVSMAFENTAFVGAEAIDVVNELAGVRSPYEVFRSPDPSLPAQVSDLLRAQGISESVGDIAENIDQKIMSQIFSEELDQSIEENMPEIKQLSREVSEEGIVDVDREAKYAQQIRSEIFTHELEEDISCCSPEKKEITYGVHISKGSHEASSLPHEFGDHTQKMFTPTDNDNSLLKSVSPVASVSLALSTASLQESISAHSAYSTEGDVHSYNDERLSPRESDILPPEHVPTHDAISPVPSHEVPEQSMSVSPHPPPSEIPITSSNAVVSVLSSSIHLAQSDTLEDKAREIIDQTSKGPYFQTQRAVPDSLPFDTNDHDTSFQRELSPVCTAIEQRTEQVTWEVPVHQQSVDIITEEVKMIPTEKQLIVEHDEEGDTSDFNTSHYPDEKEARDIAQKIIHDIKTAVATRPPLTQVSSEISDEDLVERDEPSFHEIESPHSQYEQGFSKKVIEEQQEGDTLQLKDQVVAQTDSRVVIHTKTVAIDVVQKEESGSDKKDSSSTEEKLLESRSETDTSDQMTGGVVLRGKTKKHEEKRVSREIESYSSSGETESHYYSYDTSDSARTPRGTPAASRPCSSEFEINVTSGQASEYETCVTSQNGSSSYMTAASSQDGSFMTARSSVSHSSRESAYSGDSESSGHLASVEVSSEASETLVPSAQDLELDLTREVETPTMDEESHFLLDGSVKEPYDTEIPESIIRSGIEIPFMKEMQFGMQGRDSFHKEKDEPSSPFEMVADDGVGYSGDAVSKKWQDEKTAYFGSYRRSDSSDSSSSTVGSNTPSTKPKSVGITTDQAAAELLPPQSPDEQSIEPHGFSAEDIDHLDQKCSITENEAFSASESSVTRSEHTWQSNSTDTVIYTSQTQSTTQTISTASSTISQYSCAPPEEPSWYAQVNGPVEVDYIPEYDVPEEYMQPSNEQHHVQMHEAPPSMPAPSRMEEVQTSITAVDRITDPSEEYIESMLSDQEMQDITNIQDEIECQEALLREYQKQDASATQSIGHGSLKDVHHPSLPESELEEEYQQQVEESTALSHGIPFIPAQEFMQPLDERSSLPECEQGDLPSDFHIHDSKQQKLPSQKGQADIGAEVKGAQSSSTELPSSLKSTLTDSFEIVEKADILDTSPEDDRYEDITKDVDEVQPHCVDLPAQFLNENEKKALDALNYNTQVAPNICEEDDEAMELGSDKAPEERDELDESSMKNSYSYGMQFERAHDFDDEDMQNYGDMELWTHQEVDEETFVVDIDEKPKFVAPSAEFDTLAGRKFFSKSGEQDDASTSSLQEFEHFEAEMASGRKSSTSSADSINCRQIHSKSGEHDDVSMNSLTEFEKLERECIDVDKPEAAAKEDTNRLTEIEEGHESQDSEASQETLSGHEDDSDDSNDSDDYEKRMSEIEEIIKQAQTNVEKFQTEGSEAIHQTVRSGTFSGTGSTESSLLGRSPSPKKPDEDSLEEEAKLAHCTHTHKREQSETVATTSALPRHLLAERTISGHSIESWESFPKSSASTATQYDTESLRDQDLDVEDGDLDYLHEKRHLSDKDSDDELAPDSLYECNFMEKDSLRERSHEMDSLEEEKTAMQDSLYSVKDIDHDEILSGEYNFQHHTSGRETSMSDDAQLKKEMEAILLDSSLKGDCMISSTDSLEPSSSTATHATYQFETDSMMSSSINSAQTSGEESTMVFSTDTFEQDPKTVYSYSESDSFKTVISAGHSSEKDFDISTITSSSLESGDSTKAQTLLEESMFGYVGKSETDLQEPVVEEVRTVDDKGNVVITRKMKRVVVVDPVLYGATSADTEERMREFLKQSLGSGEEEMEEQRSIDETGNVTITRTIKRHVLSEPQVHTQTFTGPDAELKSQEYVKSFKKMLPTEDVDDFEDTDEHGNIIKVSQQVIIQPEVRTLTFTGPDAHEQMEEYMRSCSTEAAFLEREDSKGSKPKSSPTHSSSSHDANIVTASAPPSSVLGSHLVTGFANQPVQQGMSADHFQAEDFNRGGMDEVQIQNNFWVDSGDGSQQQLGTRVVTTRTTTRVFPTGEEQVIADTSQTETADDQLRRSMQNILDQFMDTEAPKEKK